MHTPASVRRHPIHPMLVPVPIGLWLFSFIADLIHLAGHGGGRWETVAFYTMVGGVAGGLIAAVPGFIDMLSLPRSPKRTALIHMALNLTIVVLYVINVGARMAGAEPGAMVWLSLLAVALLTVSGWLGGKMVYELGVAVDPAAPQVATVPERPTTGKRLAT